MYFLLMLLSLIYASLLADCDYMAMLAKQGYQISDFNEADYYFRFQKDRSCEIYQEDGYGIVYYRNGQYTVPYDHSDPLDEDNQAYYLFGEYQHSWYQHHGPSGQTTFPQPDFPGYYWNDSNYQSDHPSRPDYDWIDISSNCTQVSFPTNDTGTDLLDIGFYFEFYGTNYTQFRINPNGWIGFGDEGLQVVYDTNFTNTDSYVENELAVLFSTEPYPEPLDIAENRIMIPDNNATIVLGHDRNRAWESRHAISQHPFRFIWNDKTYTFQHNGAHDYKEAMRYYCMQHDDNWFDLYPLNWEVYGSTIEDLSTVNDTEILFHYIMAHIIEYKGDVVGGIISALNEEAVYDDVNDVYLNFDELFQDDITNQINITLSDGDALYVFKNTSSGSSYNLSYKDYGNYVGIKTQDPVQAGTQIPQFALVKIPRDGNIVTYENIFDLDAKLFSSGITWTSYPRLTEQGTSGGEIFEQAYYENGDPGLLQLTSIGDPTINDFDIIYSHRNSNDIYIDYDGENFIDHLFENMLFRHEGYKVEVLDGAEPTVLIVDGNRLESYTLAEMSALQNFWLGYFIPYSQNIEDAFGDEFHNVNRVWAEDWYYDAHYIQRGLGASLPSNSTKDKTMEYGKMYIVQMYRDVEEFSWNESETVEEPTQKATPENFSYEEKMDYEVIDVVSIPSNVTEIGVFEDEVCIGAIAVEDSSEQILVYSDNANRDPIPFTFEIVTGRGFSTPIKDYLVLNQRTGEFEPSVIISGQQGYSAIMFGDQEESENTIARPVLNGNYPNPFNPTTTISFSLPAEQDIELTIYNIKGQKVKTLYSGIADVGEHTVVWEGKDNNDKQVSSGIYFYKLKADNKELTRKMLMMK